MSFPCLNQNFLRLKPSRFYFIAIVVSFCYNSCSEEGELFSNPTPTQTGIDFTNKLTPTDELNILDYLYFYNGGGVAIGDINGDKLPDIYFSANQTKNKLYINEGNLKFKDITESAGVGGKSSWNTGSVMADVNGDGLLDIYVCAVVGLNGFRGHNELFINNGDNTFSEKSKEFGLDFDTYSSTATFLDYDLDGDLDMYLLNHAVHTQESFGEIDLRNKRSYETGDRLLRNDNNKFVDVSEEAGIFGGVNGYGLGVSVSDFNMDGYPDLYVGNDFHEDDYFYINNGDGTFSDQLRQYFGHTTRFSMGNDVADINHDGWPDIISLDMLSEDEKVLKSSEGDEQIQIQKLRTERYGYHYQYTRNMLFINQPNSGFSETALASGIAATDWSWSALFGDYNQDGEQDLFISNGIPKRPNNLDFIRFVSNDQIQSKINNTKLVDQQALDMMPSGAVANYIFAGSEKTSFLDRSDTWIVQDTTVSGATALADLDLDGDLDIVTNNINAAATLYINKSDGASSFLKIKFKYNQKNSYGIGTKVYAYSQGRLQYRELNNIRGFQSSSEPILHFGFGKMKKIDSLKIVWPNKTSQVLRNIKLNRTLTIEPQNTKPFSYTTIKAKPVLLFEKDSSSLGIKFKHQEDSYSDFTRQKLLPYSYADRGPALAIGDINADGKKDVFFGSSKFKNPAFFIQNEEGFTLMEDDSLLIDNKSEEVVAKFVDLKNGDKQNLIIGTAGGDFFGNAEPLLNKIVGISGKEHNMRSIENHYDNTTVLAPNDFDGDGDIDVFVGNSIITGDFGKRPKSYMLINVDGELEYSEEYSFIPDGFITDAIWSDYDNDGTKDLIVVGEWMAPKVYTNTGAKFEVKDMVPNDLRGLWRKVIEYDIDKDGDMDYLLGNWGLNSKFKASKDSPLKMWYGDIDSNGQTETIIAQEKDGKYYGIANLDELGAQMVGLRKKFTSNKAFAGRSIDEIFDKEQLKNSEVLELSTLASGYLKNENGKFKFIAFPKLMQVSPVTAFLKFDFNKDGHEEVLVAGNYFGVTPYHGRFDSFSGALIYSEENIISGANLGLDFYNRSARHLSILQFKDKPYLMTVFNNDSIQVYKLKNY